MSISGPNIIDRFRYYFNDLYIFVKELFFMWHVSWKWIFFAFSWYFQVEYHEYPHWNSFDRKLKAFKTNETKHITFYSSRCSVPDTENRCAPLFLLWDTWPRRLRHRESKTLFRLFCCCYCFLILYRIRKFLNWSKLSV